MMIFENLSHDFAQGYNGGVAKTALKNKSDPHGSVCKSWTPEFLSRFPLEPTCRCIANENKRRQCNEEEGGVIIIIGFWTLVSLCV